MNDSLVATVIGEDRPGLVESIAVDDPKFIAGRWSLGLGHRAGTIDRTGAAGFLLYEPYMLVQDGALWSIDGQEALAAPIRLR